MARRCSISSMCLSVRYSLRNATTEGGKQSAATILEHEMDHAVDDAQNHKNHVDRANIIILQAFLDTQNIENQRNKIR